jgi:hypothetical protein
MTAHLTRLVAGHTRIESRPERHPAPYAGQPNPVARERRDNPGAKDSKTLFVKLCGPGASRRPLPICDFDGYMQVRPFF